MEDIAVFKARLYEAFAGAGYPDPECEAMRLSKLAVHVLELMEDLHERALL